MIVHEQSEGDGCVASQLLLAFAFMLSCWTAAASLPLHALFLYYTIHHPHSHCNSNIDTTAPPLSSPYRRPIPPLSPCTSRFRTPDPRAYINSSLAPLMARGLASYRGDLCFLLGTQRSISGVCFTGSAERRTGGSVAGLWESRGRSEQEQVNDGGLARRSPNCFVGWKSESKL